MQSQQKLRTPSVPHQTQFQQIQIANPSALNRQPQQFPQQQSYPQPQYLSPQQYPQQQYQQQQYPQQQYSNNINQIPTTTIVIQQQQQKEMQRLDQIIADQRGMVQIAQSGISVDELRYFLEDLQQRYEKMAQELQRAASKDIKTQNMQTDNVTDFNQKLLSFQKERDAYQLELKRKDDEIQYLNSQIVSIRNASKNENNSIQQENEKLSIALADRLDQMNELFKVKVTELDQVKSLLALREQEVKEWRSRKQSNNSEDFQFRSDQKQKSFADQQMMSEMQLLKSQLQEKEQELNTLKIKYEYKQKTNQSNVDYTNELYMLKQDIRQKDEYIEQLHHQLSEQNEGNHDDLSSEKEQILQNEIRRLNQTIIELRNSLEKHSQQVSDSQWVKQKLVEQQKEIQQLRVSQNVRSSNTQQQYDKTQIVTQYQY